MLRNSIGKDIRKLSHNEKHRLFAAEKRSRDGAFLFFYNIKGLTREKNQKTHLKRSK